MLRSSAMTHGAIAAGKPAHTSTIRLLSTGERPTVADLSLVGGLRSHRRGACRKEASARVSRSAKAIGGRVTTESAIAKGNQPQSRRRNLRKRLRTLTNKGTAQTFGRTHLRNACEASDECAKIPCLRENLPTNENGRKQLRSPSTLPT